jgi:hypothetical protein
VEANLRGLFGVIRRFLSTRACDTQPFGKGPWRRRLAFARASAARLDRKWLSYSGNDAASSKRRCRASGCSCCKLVVSAYNQEQIARRHMIELGGEMRGENSHLVLAEPGSD